MGFKDLRNSGEIREKTYFEYDEDTIYRPSVKTVNQSTQEVIMNVLNEYKELTSKELFQYTSKHKNVSWSTVTRAANNLSQVTKENNKYKLC